LGSYQRRALRKSGGERTTDQALNLTSEAQPLRAVTPIDGGAGNDFDLEFVGSQKGRQAFNLSR